MKTKLLSLALLAVFALPVSAQTYGGGTSASQPAAPSQSGSAASGSDRSTNRQYGEGGSTRCDSLSGAEKQTCLQDEGAKTDRTQEPAAAAPGGSTTREPDASGGHSGMNATQSND